MASRAPSASLSAMRSKMARCCDTGILHSIGGLEIDHPKDEQPFVDRFELLQQRLVFDQRREPLMELSVEFRQLLDRSLGAPAHSTPDFG